MGKLKTKKKKSWNFVYILGNQITLQFHDLKKMSQTRQIRESLFTFLAKFYRSFSNLTIFFSKKFKFAEFKILRFLKHVWTPCSKIQSTYKHHHHKGGCDVSWRWSPTTDEMVMCTWSNISANVKENKIFKIIIFFRKLNK